MRRPGGECGLLLLSIRLPVTAFSNSVARQGIIFIPMNAGLVFGANTFTVKFF